MINNSFSVIFNFIADGSLSSGDIAGIVIGVLLGVVLLVLLAGYGYVRIQRAKDAERQAINMNFDNPTYAKEDEAPINDMFNSPFTQVQRIDSVDSDDT